VVGEIGTLRALGFRRGAVLAAFLGESLLLALVAGVVGLGAATLMQTVNISTVNFQTFSELAFQFRMTGTIVLQAPGFALAMGFVGGFIPAWRAAQLKIVDCLRAAWRAEPPGRGPHGPEPGPDSGWRQQHFCHSRPDRMDG